MTTATIESRDDVMDRAKASTLISPRFYTTDYKAMDRLDISPVRAEWDAMMAEYEGDNNHDHFQRDDNFAREIRQLPESLQQEFLDFLVSSITSEYSGCVLYNEIRKNVDNPDIKQLMTYLTRDESRHANFINASLRQCFSCCSSCIACCNMCVRKVGYLVAEKRFVAIPLLPPLPPPDKDATSSKFVVEIQCSNRACRYQGPPQPRRRGNHWGRCAT